MYNIYIFIESTTEQKWRPKNLIREKQYKNKHQIEVNTVVNVNVDTPLWQRKHCLKSTDLLV